MEALVAWNESHVPQELIEEARGFVTDSRAPSTRLRYRWGWENFSAWCEAHSVASLPATPETVALYVADRARSVKPGTIENEVSAIARAHFTASHASPCTHIVVESVMAGIRRRHGMKANQKAALRLVDLRRMLLALRPGLIGLRDKAMLLLHYAGAFRRGELVGLDVGDLEFRADGLVVTVRRSKTDQESAGEQVPISAGSNPETCPIRALRAWLAAASVVAGPVLRSVSRHGAVGGRLDGKEVARVIKIACVSVGMDETRYSGHSPRAGLVTDAFAASVPRHVIRRTTRHKSENVLIQYEREAEILRGCASSAVGL